MAVVLPAAASYCCRRHCGWDHLLSNCSAAQSMEIKWKRHCCILTLHALPVPGSLAVHETIAVVGILGCCVVCHVGGEEMASCVGGSLPGGLHTKEPSSDTHDCAGWAAPQGMCASGHKPHCQPALLPGPIAAVDNARVPGTSMGERGCEVVDRPFCCSSGWTAIGDRCWPLLAVMCGPPAPYGRARAVLLRSSALKAELWATLEGALLSLHELSKDAAREKYMVSQPLVHPVALNMRRTIGPFPAPQEYCLKLQSKVCCS
jgi:hypothetical protein